jgi:orotate phosphoribosyltransferase
MDQRQVCEILTEVGAIVTNDHFVFTNDSHSATYINKNALYANTEATSLLCRALAEAFADDKVDAIVGPAIGGVILSQWTASHLSRLTGRLVSSLYAEHATPVSVEADPKTPGLKRISLGLKKEWQLLRGYGKLVEDKNILVIEDTLTTGRTTCGVIEAVLKKGGNVIGLGTIWNRSNRALHDIAKVPKTAALVEIELEMWSPSTCPLCKQGVPINTEFGKGREFLAQLSHQAQST